MFHEQAGSHPFGAGFLAVAKNQRTRMTRAHRAGKTSGMVKVAVVAASLAAGLNLSLGGASRTASLERWTHLDDGEWDRGSAPTSARRVLAQLWPPESSERQAVDKLVSALVERRDHGAWSLKQLAAMWELELGEAFKLAIALSSTKGVLREEWVLPTQPAETVLPLQVAYQLLDGSLEDDRLAGAEPRFAVGRLVRAAAGA